MLLLAITGVTSAPASAAVLVVCQDGSCDFTSISEAIAASADGDVIEIRPGTYDLPAGQGLQIFNRTLKLEGTGDPSDTVIRGGDGASVIDIRSSFGDTVVIRNLEIRNGGTDAGGGIYAQDVELSLSNCRFIRNEAFAGGALCAVTSSVDIDACRFARNVATGPGGAIYGEFSSFTIDGTLFDDNSASEGGGFGSLSSSSIITDCRFAENLATVVGGAIVSNGTDAVTTPSVNDSFFCGNGNPPISGAFFDEGNDFVEFCTECDKSPDLVRTWVDPSTDCNGDLKVDSCQIDSGELEDLNLNQILDVCEGVLVFEVPSIFPTISAAVEAAPEGGRIQLAPGTYEETIDLGSRNLQLLGDASTPGAVVIDGSALQGRLLAIQGGQSADTRIRGITFRNGDSMGDPGGAIVITDSSPRVFDCIFESNLGSYGGAIHATGGAPWIRDCVFTGNGGSKGAALSITAGVGRAVVERCAFQSNLSTDDGGALFLRDPDVRILESSFDGNLTNDQGGAIRTNGAGTVEIDACSFVGNTAGVAGGGLWIASSVAVSVKDSLFDENAPDDIDGAFEDLGGNDFGEEPTPCPGDLDGDGVVGGSDLGLFLVVFGTDDPTGDLDGDGVVGGGDLGFLLVGWGLCP